MRIIMSLLLAAGCALAGIGSARRLRWRCALLGEMMGALHALEGEIRFGAVPLPAAAKRIAQGQSGAFFQAFSAALEKNLSPCEAWADAEETGALEGLEGEELEVLRRFARSLGKGGQREQAEEFERTERELERILAAAREKAHTGARLRTTLGVLCGAALWIILI